MNAAHHNDVGISLFGFARQCQAVANEVGNFLKVRLCVVVRHDDGILLSGHAAYLIAQVSPGRHWLGHISCLHPFFTIVNHLFYYYSFFNLFINIIEDEDYTWWISL